MVVRSLLAFGLLASAAAPSTLVDGTFDCVTGKAGLHQLLRQPFQHQHLGLRREPEAPRFQIRWPGSVVQRSVARNRNLGAKEAVQ